MKTLLNPTRAKRSPWSPDEDFFLESVAHTPNLYKYWTKWAEEKGWPPRSEKSIRERCRKLGEGRQSESFDGWVSGERLILYLGLSDTSNVTIKRWVKMGLKAHQEERRGIKIHLADFVDFALGAGAETVARAVYQNRLALAWLLKAIADWRHEKAPELLDPSLLPSPPKRIYKKRRKPDDGN